MTDENQCTCGAPLGAEHNPGCPKLKIWTPPERLDANVQRMAWLLFLESWKESEQNTDEWTDQVTRETYSDCLRVAKLVRQMEQAPQ